MTDAIRKQLIHYKQDELVDYIDRNPHNGKQILSQCESMGIERVFDDFARSMKRHQEVGEGEGNHNKCVYPPKSVQGAQFNATTREELKEKLKQIDIRETPVVLLRKAELPAETQNIFHKEGCRVIQEGKLGCVIMAGGQGSRLKFDGPKGCYVLQDLPTKPTLFRVIVERLAALKRKVSAKTVPLYIMVSIQNEAATREHFEANDYFDLPKDDVIFFQQTIMPSFDDKGHALLESPDKITRNPNGNGGVFESLRLSGALDDMKERKLELVHIVGVDNVLVKLADPIFIGMSSLSGTPVANKCVTKSDPYEKVGVQAYFEETHPDSKQVVKKPCVVEYTEISEQQRLARLDPKKPDGDLLFSAGNICNACFTLKHIEAVLANPEFEYHIAVKALKVYDPTTENYTTITGIKLEYFIFDSFLSAESVFVLEANRDEEFSAVKKADGVDSPHSASTDLLNMHRKWLTAAGIELDGAKCEVVPGVSYDGEGLQHLRGKKASECNPLIML